MNRAVSAALAAGAAVLAAVVLTAPPPPPLATVQAAVPLPRLPRVPAAADPADALNVLATTTVWGPRPPAGAAAAVAAASAPPPEPRWRVSGTLWRQGQWRLVLQDDDRRAPTQTLAAGERLPDGRLVLEVRRDGARLTATPPPKRRGRAPAEVWIDVPRRSPAP